MRTYKLHSQLHARAFDTINGEQVLYPSVVAHCRCMTKREIIRQSQTTTCQSLSINTIRDTPWNSLACSHRALDDDALHRDGFGSSAPPYVPQSDIRFQLVRIRPLMGKPTISCIRLMGPIDTGSACIPTSGNIRSERHVGRARCPWHHRPYTRRCEESSIS
jgi:hypothetical protein